MENPLEQIAPEDVIKRVTVFARDFAYGITQGLWGAEIGITLSGVGEDWYNWEDKEGNFTKYISNKWNNKPPFITLLQLFGYFKVYERKSNYEIHYIPTEAAFELLRKPTELPSIFISYRRHESSVLALLVEARLRLADEMIGVFIDRDIPTQTRWEKYLKERVIEANIMVCLIAPDTLKSGFVQDEILLAIETGKTIISILHLGYELPEERTGETDNEWKIIEELKDWQAIKVEDPVSAEKYEIAINRMLNDMGYSTY